MNLFYRHFGEGTPVIIQHGLFGQSDNWVTVGRRIADQFSVYIPDLRNHGQSPHASVHTYQAMSDDLLDFMDDLSIDKAIIIGHSMGGKAAMNFTLEHPRMVEKLVVVDICPKRYPERNIHTQVITQMLSLDLEKAGTRTEIEKMLEQKIPDARIRMFILKNLYYRLPGQLAWRLNLDAINNSLDQLFDGISVEGSYEGPTLFIRGGKSDYILDEDFPLIHQYFPNALIKTIPGASHWVHADAPEELCLLLSGFLGRECQFPPTR
ncbi:MAG: alpha/beta fold hydrolase [Bacteroidales bacterium]|nr:alpha/beta fold hydrolase [Bacteroidales bacterium]